METLKLTEMENIQGGDFWKCVHTYAAIGWALGGYEGASAGYTLGLLSC